MKKALSVVLLAVVIFGLGFESFAFAKKRNRVAKGSLLPFVKVNPVASTGACLNKVGSEKLAKAILARNNVHFSSKANPTQLKTLATAVYQIERLTGGQNKFISGVHLRFPKVKGFSQYRVGTPYVDMGANFTDSNIAHITHEMGHYAGHAGLYPLYYKRVPPCKFTNYTYAYYHPSAKRNEEFAEAWAAFITRPELLSKSSIPACRRAYDFFLEIFPRGKQLASCDAKLSR